MRDLPEPNRRRLIIGAIVIAAAIVGLYFLIPKLAGLNQTWGQLTHGNPWLIVLGGILELLSVAGYTVLFHTVFARGIERITWCVTIQITLAGIAAIRLLSGAGVGGVAVSAWALSRAGMPSTVIAYWGFDIAVLGLSFKDLQSGDVCCGARDGLPRRHVRQPAAAAGRGRRHRGRDDRLLCGIRQSGRPRGRRRSCLSGNLVLASHDPRHRRLLQAPLGRA